MERERFELHKVLVGEISKGMEQVKQVKASSSNDQDRLLETMLASYRDALSILTGSTPDEQSRSVITSSLDPPGSARMKRKRQPMLDTKVIVRSPDDDDGYSWRQYGRKHVLPSKNMREYYKCGRKGCPGRKHVEKLDDDSNSFVVTYRGRHTCSKTRRSQSLS